MTVIHVSCNQAGHHVGLYSNVTPVMYQHLVTLQHVSASGHS